MCNDETYKRFFADNEVQTALNKCDLDVVYLLWNHDSRELTSYLRSCDIEPLDYLTFVPAYYDHGNEFIKKIIIPENIIRVSYAAFADCINLVSITLPATLESISSSVFCRTPIKDIVYEGSKYDFCTKLELDPECGLDSDTPVHCNNGNLTVSDNKKFHH